MRKVEHDNIVNVIDSYCDVGKTPTDLASNMGTNGVDFVKGGGLAIYNVDMFEELQKVYGGDFKPGVYLKYAENINNPDVVLDGISYDFRYKNGVPYVFTVYCQKFGQVLDTLKQKA